MYSNKTNILLGFHGCDKKIRDYVINGGNLKPSQNDYDWLGNGFYFWENDPKRALEWAKELSQRPNSSISEPSVLGAVIDLGHCLDLSNQESIQLLKLSYDMFMKRCKLNNITPPINENIGGSKDLLLRRLDCAVFQNLHELIELGFKLDSNLNLKPFDSVRGVFEEGEDVYEGAGFKEKTHTQLCITNPNCIKGYFMPRELDKKYPSP